MALLLYVEVRILHPITERMWTKYGQKDRKTERYRLNTNFIHVGDPNYGRQPLRFEPAENPFLLYLKTERIVSLAGPSFLKRLLPIVSLYINPLARLGR